MFAIIDIGSNSLRLLILNSQQECLFEDKETCQLGQGLIESGKMNEENILLSIKALKRFKESAQKFDAKIYPFATAAVRRAENGDDFIKRVKKECGLNIHKLCGEEEGEVGFLGATSSQSGQALVIDIGGASTELCVGSGEKVLFSKSFDVGAVKVFEKCRWDRLMIENYVNEFIKEIKLDIKFEKAIAIGGTNTSISALLLKLKNYDKTQTHGFEIQKQKLFELKTSVQGFSQLERNNMAVLDEKRRQTIGGGMEILYQIMEKLQIEKVTTSENDNLLGYFLKYIK